VTPCSATATPVASCGLRATEVRGVVSTPRKRRAGTARRTSSRARGRCARTEGTEGSKVGPEKHALPNRTEGVAGGSLTD